MGVEFATMGLHTKHADHSDSRSWSYSGFADDNTADVNLSSYVKIYLARINAIDMKKKSTSIKAILKITGLPVLVASLCCLTPVILVAFGLGTTALATSLANTLYGQYRWIFRLSGLLLLGISLALYLRREKGICTLDAVRRRRNEVFNLIMITLTVTVIGYVVWLYGVVEYLGKWLNIWS